MQLSLGLNNEAPLTGVESLRFDAAGVLKLLQAWQDAGWLRLLDLQFARFLHTEIPDASGLLLLAAALASHQLGRGHVCLELAATLDGPERVLNLPPDQTSSFGQSQRSKSAGDSSNDVMPLKPADLLARLTLPDWEAAFHSSVVSDGSWAAPLVYEKGRLYLYRYWRYEQRVAAGIANRLSASESDALPPVDSVKAVLDQLFPPSASDIDIDWQRLACALAARQRFAIVTGGPGTGKTTTVVRLLALLQALHVAGVHDANQAALRIRLAAPTGKAATRLSESIGGKVGELPWASLGGEALAHTIPTQVVTLHKLLGGRPHSRKRTYNADNPLPLDVLVIDEASMVSLSDMADVIAALPSQARLVLIGDKDQLSSVEAGAVLGELCGRATEGHYLPSIAAWLKEVSDMEAPAGMQDREGKSLDQAVAMLRFSHRFAGDSGIGRLAQAVNEGRVGAVRELLSDPRPDLSYLQIKEPQGDTYTRFLLHGHTDKSPPESRGGVQRQGYSHYLGLLAQEPGVLELAAYDAWAAKVLQAHRAFQVLCVLRQGPWGVEGLNRSIAQALHARGLIPAAAGWYAGRPVMVTRNNRALRLSNGDIGVVLPCPTGEGRDTALRVAFPDHQGTGVRWFAPNRLDDVETVYALTVHKSQGSEFMHTALVLPQTPAPVLTRELLYTGITRASHWFSLVNPGGEGLLKHAVTQRIYRSGGLGERLFSMN